VKPAVLLRLALAGTRADTARVLLTAVSALLATLAVLSALTVLAVPTPQQSGNSEQYVNALLREPGLRPGLAFALMLLTIPVLALAGQCARLGAPARDRRLAAIRLAGASPGQTVLIAVAETGLAALLGTVLGFGAYFAGREVLHRPRGDGRLPLPTDVLPEPGVLAAAFLGLPLLAALVTGFVLRRVTVSPFGVVKGVRRKRAPWPWPGILIAVGVGSFTARSAYTGESAPSWLFALVLFGGSFLAALGVVLGAGWITYTTGRLLRRYARPPCWPVAGWSPTRGAAAGTSPRCWRAWCSARARPASGAGSSPTNSSNRSATVSSSANWAGRGNRCRPTRSTRRPWISSTWR
jgi:hypothetical protein